MKSRFFLISLISLMAALFLASLAIGPAQLGLGAVARALFGGGEAVDILIVQELRLPRAILAAVIGATLALTGASLQGLVRNPLAAPEMFGAPGAAAFGAVVMLATGATGRLSYLLPFVAMLSTLASVWALLALAGRNASMLTLLLAGLALSSLTGAAISLVLNLAPNPYAALDIAFWLLGSLEDLSFRHLAIAGPFILGAWVLLLATRGQLRVLTLGEDVARTSGVDMARLTFLTLLGVALGVGGVVAVAGVIGFVGLIVPHIIRPFVGHDPARIHVPAMLGGAALVLAADCGSRLIPSNGEIRIGVLTAMIGVLFFIWLVLKERGRDLLQAQGGTP